MNNAAESIIMTITIGVAALFFGALSAGFLSASAELLISNSIINIILGLLLGFTGAITPALIVWGVREFLIDEIEQEIKYNLSKFI